MDKRKFNKAPEFIRKTDFTELRTQKRMLLETINNDAVDPEHKEGLEGILALIDAIQDYAVDEMGVPEMLVFDFEKEEERECCTNGLHIPSYALPTGIKATKGGEVKEGDVLKTVWLCTSCNSDNIEQTVNFKPKLNSINPDGYCHDCHNKGLYTAELKADAKVEGFQVIADPNGNEEEGNIHPDMEGSFCLYNLTQAKEMIENSECPKDWQLLACWVGDVEEPTLMFEGDPRD